MGGPSQRFHGEGWFLQGLVVACALVSVVCASKGEENQSLIIGEDETASCIKHGFDPARLGCATCDALGQRLEESGGDVGKALIKQCLGCCHASAKVELFRSARLLADAGQQERDQDLHDFIKRKAAHFPGLEVEYQEGASPAIELENEDNPNYVLRADVSGWKSEDLVKFVSARLEKPADSAAENAGDALADVQKWTSEVQSCSGWRLNQLPEVRKFIKEPGHADTYLGLKVNFIPHHNPDLVFFDQHGQEKERLDLGRFSCDEIHKLMQDKGFQRKKARKVMGEIRTCSGWRLNQLPDVRRFVLGKGNADSYIGLRINFIPHHSPVFIALDENGEEGEEIDMSTYTFEQLHELFQSKGLVQKMLL